MPQLSRGVYINFNIRGKVRHQLVVSVRSLYISTYEKFIGYRRFKHGSFFSGIGLNLYRCSRARGVRVNACKMWRSLELVMAVLRGGFVASCARNAMNCMQACNANQRDGGSIS